MQNINFRSNSWPNITIESDTSLLPTTDISELYVRHTVKNTRFYLEHKSNDAGFPLDFWYIGDGIFAPFSFSGPKSDGGG